MNPYLIKGPAIISFSGGRTSAFMLWLIIQAYGGTLPNDVIVCFTNTGREMAQSLQFVKDCGEHFGVEIVLLEYADHDDPQRRWKRVTWEILSRNGEPFDALIARKKYLPNVMARFCTQELKIRVMRGYARALGWDHWTNVVGLRADEAHRVGSLRDAAERERWDVAVPLYTDKKTKRDVGEFWRNRNFGLQLQSVKGVTPMGNCDLCFLKGQATLVGIARMMPDAAAWWLQKEIERGGTWSKRFTMAELIRTAEHPDLFDDTALPDAPVGDCFCTGDQ